MSNNAPICANCIHSKVCEYATKGFSICDFFELEVAPVRCKDCKFRSDGLYCRLGGRALIMTNVDFCSRGKRKGE